MSNTDTLSSEDTVRPILMTREIHFISNNLNGRNFIHILYWPWPLFVCTHVMKTLGIGIGRPDKVKTELRDITILFKYKNNIIQLLLLQ